MKKLMFVLVVLFVASFNGAIAQEVHLANIGFTVDVSGTPLDIQNAADLAVAGLTAGQSAALVPDGADAFIDGATTNPVYSAIVGGSTPGAVDITGDASARVIVSFALPTVLFADGFSGTVTVAYNGTSAIWLDEAGNPHYFNPNVPETIMLSPVAGTATHLNLGGIFTVTPNSAAAVYTGDALVTVAYSSN